jgi:hypothetical protein
MVSSLPLLPPTSNTTTVIRLQALGLPPPIRWSPLSGEGLWLTMPPTEQMYLEPKV